MADDQDEDGGRDYVSEICAEIAGTAVLMYFGCMGCSVWVPGLGPTIPAFTFGMGVASAVQVFGPISGGHFNPAVSLAVLILGRLSPLRFCLYILAQYIGSLVGYTMLYFSLPTGKNTCLLALNEGTTPVQGFFIELCVTMILALVVGSLNDPKNAGKEDSVPIRVGLIITGMVYCAGPFTGAALNPARSLAPSLWNRNFKDHWVFQLGPYVGGACGGVVYRFIYDTERNTIPKRISAKLP